MDDVVTYTAPGDELTDWFDARDQARREREKAWEEKNPEASKFRKAKHSRSRRGNAYLSRPFVALDSEGQDVLGNAILRGERPYEDHQIFMWGAATINETLPAYWLVHPETTNNSERALDPLAVLEWLVALPEQYPDATFVMFSFSYDVIHILKTSAF